MKRSAAPRAARQKQHHPEDDTERLLAQAIASVKVSLTTDQRAALEYIVQRRSIFLTGAAGTGKSALLHVIVEYIQLSGRRVLRTAATGLAAYLIGGGTLHSATGIGIDANATAQECMQGLLKNPEWTDKQVFAHPITRNLRTASALVIDEISMIDAQTLQRVNAMIQLVRGNDAPFGNLQMIFVGDFFQLPPVTRDPSTLHFAFEAEAWKQCDPVFIELTTNHRQADDPEFLVALNQLRTGESLPAAIDTLRQCFVDADPGFEQCRATRIYPLRDTVNRVNAAVRESLPLPEYTYTATDTGTINDMRAVAELRLRVGMPVMCIANTGPLLNNLVNGLRGTVRAFEMPTADDADDNSSRKARQQQPLPVVEWEDGRQHVVTTFLFTRHNSAGERIGSRKQLPLLDASAITVHAAQGMTLSSVVVGVRDIFGPHMTYVALSRCRTRGGLTCVGELLPSAVRVSPVVREFYERERKRVRRPLPVRTVATLGSAEGQREKQRPTFLQQWLAPPAKQS